MIGRLTRNVLAISTKSAQCPSPKSVDSCFRKTRESKQTRYSSSMEKDIFYKPAHSIAAQKITEFVCDRFLSDEPITVALESSRSKLYGLFQSGVEKCLKHDASFVCLDTNNQLIACSICDIHDLEKDDSDKTFDANAVDWSDDALKIIGFLDVLTVDLKQHMPGAKSAMELLFLAVDSKFKGRGIAGRLTTMCIDQSKRLGCQYCFTEATAFGSQRVFDKMGFKTVKVLEHKDYLDDKGQQIFKCKDKTTCGKLMIYKF